MFSSTYKFFALECESVGFILCKIELKSTESRLRSELIYSGKYTVKYAVRKKNIITNDKEQWFKLKEMCCHEK